MREAAGLETGTAEAAMITAIGGYPSQLSKLETARIAPKPAQVDWMISEYRPTSDEADSLRGLATTANTRAQPVSTGVDTREYLARERSASKVWMIYNEIPGLLQIHEFAYAVLSQSPLVDSSDVEALARDRAERGQRIFRADGPEVWVALGEAALDRLDGGPEIGARQLDHLLAVSAMPTAHLKIIPSSAGSVTGLSNPFTLLHEEPDEWLAFVGHIARNDYVKKPSRFRLVFEHAWDLGATEEQSRAILEARVVDLNRS
ncbi:hypothetical protein LV78_007137 [Actinosynnema pretiosum]|nr:hypothetical protein [Actinosynnema pretiosum]